MTGYVLLHHSCLTPKIFLVLTEREQVFLNVFALNPSNRAEFFKLLISQMGKPLASPARL